MSATVDRPMRVVERSPRPLDSSELLERWAAERRPSDQDELVVRFRPLARKLALRYARAGEPVDDLEQVALLGLVKALRRFDPSRGFSFSTFAVPTILGELRRHFRDTGWAAHVPRAMQERVAEVRKASETVAARKGRAATVGELSALLSCGEEEIVEALTATSSLSAGSLEDRILGDEEGDALVDRLGVHDPGYELVEDRNAIVEALTVLPEVQRRVLTLRFEEDLKQSEIAERVGVSQMQVSRLLRSALNTVTLVANSRSAA